MTTSEQAETRRFGPGGGALTLRTGVAGKAARTGHRLTIGFDTWEASVDLDGDGAAPTAVRVRVDVDSLDVLSGEGGLTPMSAPERGVARGNALKALNAKKHGEIVFDAPDVRPDGDGYRLDGTLTICGTTRPHSLRARFVGDGLDRRIEGESTVAQTDFGVKPYSAMMGALKVADEVTVHLDVAAPE